MAVSPVIGIAAAAPAAAELHDAIVRRSGGRPRRIEAGGPATRALAGVGGLIVTGEPGGASGHDPFELRLLQAALAQDMPVLGVGQGLHLINTTLGGGSPGEVEGHGVEPEAEGPAPADRASGYHRVYIAPGSKLAAVVGSGGFVRVNSRHDHGIKEAQKSRLLLASAYSLEDGVIEGLESPDHDWVIGVQFNPERRLEIPPHFDRLFQALVERAEGRVRGDGGRSAVT